MYRTPPTSHTMHLRISAARGAPAAGAAHPPPAARALARPAPPPETADVKPQCPYIFIQLQFPQTIIYTVHACACVTNPL